MSLGSTEHISLCANYSIFFCNSCSKFPLKSTLRYFAFYGDLLIVLPIRHITVGTNIKFRVPHLSLDLLWYISEISLSIVLSFLKKYILQSGIPGPTLHPIFDLILRGCASGRAFQFCDKLDSKRTLKLHSPLALCSVWPNQWNCLWVLIWPKTVNNQVPIGGKNQGKEQTRTCVLSLLWCLEAWAEC